ncbi:MAG: class I tRNA ligase family protein [Candidatus Kerfeldbacteria bacterium]|nr:class I tRNA ligase family protein [Candidatus Kerfeldbacteria bacterium]
MEKELPKAYVPADHEPRVSKQWDDSGYANPDRLPDATKRKPYSISMPPPNATGILHIGHAAFLTLQDLLIRFERMRGKRTLYLPGTDHAAIATQNVVEKELKKEGKRRQDLGRDAFLQRVDAYVKESQGTIRTQISRMGTSCDWSRERFTLDEGLSHAVRTAFVELYDDGLIYRGERIVNWCPHCQSTLADDEVEYREEKAPFYYFKYGPVVIGTARPETKFGDKVIVVHPDDTRYQKLINTAFEIEWILGPIMANVIADPAADPALGTGAMTITPAHSFTDFELAKKYSVPIVQIINEQGRLTDAAGAYAGMKIKEARQKVVEILKEKGLLARIDEDYAHNLSVCYRCGTTVEPLISKQWFVAVDRPTKRLGGKSLKQRALDVLEKKEIAFIPDRFGNVYRQWMGNLHDWCISRQIWYGHRIPVWYKRANKGIKILFIRHRESTGNKLGRHAGHSDLPLTEEGRLEARTMGQTLDPKNIAAVFTSDLSRAKETAELLVANTKKKIHVDPRLREIDYGDLTGKSSEDLLPHRVPGFPNGERYSDVVKRVESFLADVLDTYNGKTILIVGHSGTWKALEHIAKNEPLTLEKLTAKAPKKPAEFTIREVRCIAEKAPAAKGWQQDPDTLDTWFSSALWTFSTLGWPEETPDVKTYHPTSVMETGYDILFFWVARMIMMTTYLRKELPFRTVYLHGLVRDRKGRKMSKSLGNGIDPLAMADKFGADAVRLSLVIGTTPGNDQRLYEEKIAGFRNYANKIWNIGRYILLQSAVQVDATPPRPPFERGGEEGGVADRWIVSRLNRIVDEVTTHLDRFEFSMAGEKLYDFAWHELADWYVEIAKLEGNTQLARSCFETVLKLLHPFMPFVTEALWNEFRGNRDLLMVQTWPVADRQHINQSTEDEFAALQARIIELRKKRKDAGITGKEPLTVSVPKDDIAAKHQTLVEHLARVKLSPS